MTLLASVLSACGSNNPVEQTTSPETTIAANSTTSTLATTNSNAETTSSTSTSSTSTTSTSTTSTTEATDPETEILTASYQWLEDSDQVVVLQQLLEIGDDGVYGPGTRAAHLTENETRGLAIDMLPYPPVAITPVNVALVAPGSNYNVRGTGFAPDTIANVTLFSTPTHLGATTVNSDGSVNVTVAIPADIAIGDHTLELSGKSFTGGDATVSTPIIIGIDTEGPWVSGVTLSSSAVDIVNGASFTVSIEVADNGVGVGSGTFLFEGNGCSDGWNGFEVIWPQRDEPGKAIASLVAGTLNNGTWRATISVPSGSTTGCSATLVDIIACDKVGNCQSGNPSSIGITAPSISITNSGTTDLLPPWVSGVSLSPTSVDVTSGSASISVTVNGGDDSAGLTYADLSFWSTTEACHVFGFTVGWPGGGSTASLISGTPQNGTWQANVTIPSGTVPNGCTYTLGDITLCDPTNCNNAQRTPADFGFSTPSLIIYNSGYVDTSAPQPVGIALSPLSVNITTGSATVTVSIHGTDVGVGISSGTLSYRGDNCSDGFSGFEVVWPATDEPGKFTASLASGNANDGVWQATVTVPAGITGCSVYFQDIVLGDSAGNISGEIGPQFTADSLTISRDD